MWPQAGEDLCWGHRLVIEVACAWHVLNVYGPGAQVSLRSQVGTDCLSSCGWIHPNFLSALQSPAKDSS